MAREVAISMLDDKVDELEEAQKQKPKEGKSVAEKIAARKEHDFAQRHNPQTKLLNVGDTYTAPNGEKMIVVGEADGNLVVRAAQFDEGQGKYVGDPKSQTRELSQEDAANEQDAYYNSLVHNQPTQQEDAEQSQETAYVKPSEHEGKFGIGDKMTFYVDGKPIEAEVVQAEDVDGVVVQTSERVNGHLINQYTREELDALTTPPQQANDNADVVSPKSPEAGTEVQNETGEEEKSPDELPAFDGDKFNETHPADEIRPTEEKKPNEENDAVEASTSSKIPQDESGEYDYMQAEPSKAWAALLEQTEGDADMAREVAQSMLDDKVAELEEAQKQQPKEGKSVAEKIAARKEHKANIERIEKEIEQWQQILSQSEQQPTTEETKPKEETPSNHIADVSKKEEETTQQENIKLSDEVDENGRQFVLNSEGNLAFGEITEDTGLTAAPILLSEGMITNRATNDGYGLAHIEARHGEEIRKAGYKSVLDFIEQVAKNYDVIKEGNMRDGRPTYRLMLTDKHNNTLMVELSGDGTYWNINTAGIFKTSYGRKNREVYTRHTTNKQSVETTGTSQDAEHSDTQAPSRMNVPTTSDSKDTKSKTEGQEKSEESKETSLSEQISTASAEVNTEPTEAQKEAGNYKKGHVQVGTFDITIEQPEGSIRRGKDANGRQWEHKMHNTYGYFRGTEGVDGDHIDVFLSNDIDGWNGRKVFVVDQYNPDGTFDEHKVMLGFNDIDEAKSDYLANYEKGWENGRRIDVTPVNLEDFEKWIGSSHRKTKAFAEYAGVKKEDLSASENGEGKEKVKPQEEQKPKKPKNEKGEESKADGEKGKGEKIDDVGEKIEGARKDALKKLAESMEQATEEALVAMPFSKAFKRPNLKKAVEDGVLREEDALFAQAVMSAYLSRKKPLMSKSRSNYERERSEKTIKVWAHHAYNGVEKLKKLFSLSPSERDTFMMEEMNRPAYDPKDVEKRKQDLMEWNPGKVFNGTCYPINAIRLWNDVYTQLGYEVGTDVPQLFSEVLPTTGYDSYVLVAANGTKFYPARSLNSYNAVVDEIVYQTKVANADADTDHPKETFKVIGSGEMKTKSSGKWYVVTQASLSAKPHKDIFSSKEEAEKFAKAYIKNDGKKVNKYRYASAPQEVKEFDGYSEYAVVLRRKNIGKGTTTDFKLKHYNTADEARAAIDAEHDELNELANKELAKDKGSKSASTKKPICSIEVYTEDGKSWKYGIVLSDKYAPKKSALNTMPYYLAKDFNTRKEAQAYLDAHKEEIEAKAAKVDEARRNFKYFTANGERVGTDYRHGEDVSADQFREQFGFRGVQFGNWTNQRDRQEAINQAFDAFMDLSRLLGVSPRALSLNGELGVAFGARGSGKALAHYEPKEVVINLTKTSGAGSLAHEWWHALDNYFARQGNVAMGFVTQSKNIEMRDELRQAFNTLIDHLYKSPYNQRSKQRGSSYWGTPIEETARMFEQWVNDQLAERGEKSPFLTDADPYIEERYAQMNYEMYKFFMGDKAMPYEEYKQTPQALNGLVYLTRDELQTFGKDLKHIFDTIQQKVDETTGKTLMYHKGGVAVSLNSEEVTLRDAVVEVLRKSGIDVITDVSEGQRVLDMANGKERLSGKQKRALETASVSQNEKHQPTVVSSADGAKVLKELDKTKDKYENQSNRSKTFIGDVAKALGARRHGSSSEYATFETKNGKIVTIRLSSHNAKVSNFDNNEEADGISIVVSARQSNGIDNDGNAHITEFYYNAIKLRRADGKPLAEIVRSIKQALYSGEFKDTTGIAERQEVNGDVVREHRVYHGSGADFEAFDHSHMGEGEGAQAYGWGTYVTEVEGIGRTYAIKNADGYSAYINAKLEYEDAQRKYNLIVSDIAELKSNLSVYERSLESSKKLIVEHGDDQQFVDNSTKVIKRAEASIAKTNAEIEAATERLQEVKTRMKSAKERLDALPKPERYFYSVEIPEDNGKNYLDWNERLSDSQIEAIRAYLSENYRRNKLEDFDASIAESKGAPNADEVNAWARRGENVYKMLSHLLGSDDAASKALSEMGFAGIKYPAENRSGGRKDGAKNYVIFNEGDAKIVDKVRFFKTRDGEAYGFTVGGKIYIDPRIASSETAVHEYAHLWAEALRSANAKEWGNVVGLMRGTSVWNEVRERYPELKSDDEIADEVLATYSGRRGSERLREEMDRIKGSERSVADKARALGALERVKRALDRFWHGVADFLGIHYKSADEVADRVMRDLLSGVDPRRFVKGESDGMVREQFVGEMGAESADRGNIPEEAKADLAIENFQQVYADYLEGTERLKEQSDKVSADDNIDAIQGEIKGLEDAYDEAYGELLNALEVMYMAAGVSKVDAKAAAIDRASLSRAEVEMRIIDKRFMKIRSHGAEVRPVKPKVTAIEADSKPKPAEYHSASGNTVSFEGMGGLRKLDKGEFAHVERVFTKSGAFSFSGASKIESIDDVAYIFRNLENYAVENTFAALVKDGVTHVVHLGMGGPVSSMADLSALRGAYDKFGADRIYFVHNHPSGTLKPSRQDAILFDAIKQMFGSSVEVESLIIDTTSGKFSKIEDGDYRGSTSKKPIGEDVDYEVYAFDRKVYTDMFFDIEDTPSVSSSESIAGFISSHRLGNRKKVSYLVLSNQLNIMANIHTNFNGFDDVKGVVDEMVSKCIAYGGTQIVPYGNVDLSGIERVIRGVKISSGNTVSIIDALRIKNGLDYESYYDTHEEAAVYGTHSRTVGDNIAGRGEQGRSLRGDEALTALNRIFDGEVKDELPPTIPTIEKFRQIFSKPIRTFLGELIKVKDNVYNKIQKEKRTRVSGAVMPTIKNADFAMRDTDGSTLYIKRFNNNTSDSTYNIAVVNKHGEVEDYISSVHIKRDANLRNKIKNGAELLLPNKRNGDGNISRNNSTPDAKLGKISEKSDANGTLFRDEVDGVVSSSSGVDGMRERAVELGRELGADVDVVSDVSEITDANPEVQERKRRAKGWYDAKTGRVVINLAAHSDMADVEQTLLHEIVGHRGLRGLVGHENFNGFLDGIYEHASDGVREGIDDIARRKGCSRRVATEEYMSGLAEGGFADRKNAGLWQQIRQWFGDMLSRAKIKLNFSISDNELRYLLWRSHELSRMNGREGVVGRARDLAMQNRLGVGNVASKGGERAVDSYDGDLETLFRDADSPVDYERALIRDSYERRLKDVWFQSREALQDGMLSLKETMKDIWQSAGKKFSQITDIPDYANPYLGQNRLSSRNAAEVSDFKRRLFRPLLREVGRLTGFSADGRAKLTDYMMAKHGLERNKVMAERVAKHPNSLTCGP